MNHKYSLILVLISIFLFSTINESFSQTNTVPDKPTDFIADDVSPTKIELSWSPPDDDGGSPIIGYKIEYWIVEQGGTFKSLETNTGNVNTYTHSNLQTGNTYIYQIFSINAEGFSEEAAQAVAKVTSSSAPPEDIPPNPPTNLTATDISQTMILLSWKKPATNNGPPVTGYKIERKTTGSFTTIVGDTGDASTSYTNSGLITGTTYTYKVYALNSVGQSTSTAEASAKPTTSSAPPEGTEVPRTPRSFKAEATSNTEISLTWKEPAEFDGPPVSGYKLEVKKPTETEFSDLDANTGPVTSYHHTGLEPGKTYTYRLSALNSIGASSTVQASAVPVHTNVPTNLVADDVSPTQIKLSWKAPSQTYEMSIGGYKIEQVISNGVYDVVKETSGKDTSTTITGLTTGKTYTYVVSAKLTFGSTPRSDEASATPTTTSTPAVTDTVPSSPTGLKAVASSPVQIDLSWNAPSDNGGTPIIGYRIDVRIGSGSYTTLVQNTDSIIRTYSHTERTTDTTYTYKVYAINSVGTSGPSAEASATPTLSSEPEKPDTVPASPTGLKANAVSSTQINLSWNPPTNDGGKPVTGYKIEVKTGTGSYSVLTPNSGKSTSYTHTGLVSGTTYTYKVSAINSIGTSTASAEASATPIVEEIEEPKSNPADFIESQNGAQYYLDRYNNEPAYKSWFDDNFPDYTIEEAIELAIPGSFPEEPEPKQILPFVDPNQDPQYYINRYNSESSYKSWFDANFPDYTIYEAVGVEPPAPPPPPKIGICGKGTHLVGDKCVAETKGGGCLIATATFGSELSYQVQQLREIRDSTLLSTDSGSAFLNGFNSVYYTFSPTIADWERQNPVFKESVKLAITPLLSTLAILNYADIDSEEEVLGYGIGIILLNIGIYFVMPAIIVYKALRIYKSRK